MTKRFSGAGKFAAIGLAVVAAVAMPLGASARGHGGHSGGGHYSNSYRGGYSQGYGHGGYGYSRGGYGHGGYWSGGRWIAGAIVTGAVIGLINNAARPTYYDAPVVYSQSPTVIYERAPMVSRRVVETRTVVYDDPSQTRYIRDDGYDGD